jgi:tetratricopeptide (TPR) repeat protein
MPFGDVDAWIDHDLPVAADDAYPRPGFIRGDDAWGRPDGARLTFLEAVLRALAETTDEDYDSGRWARRVQTVDGPMDVRLSLPRLLDQMTHDGADAPRPVSGPPSAFGLRYDMERAMRQVALRLQDSQVESPEEAKRLYEEALNAPPGARAASDPTASPLERAQDLAYEAMSVEGRRQIQLARRAIALSRDCADAWAILGRRTFDSVREIAMYREAVAAGERAIGPELFEKEAGHFWGLVQTRPYMRARFALADCLDAEGATDEAIQHYRELLRLNPNDNQAVRQPLLLCLLDEGRLDEAQAVIELHKDDERPDWLYAAALVAFRATGGSSAASEKLALALASNRHVPPFLTGEREIPDRPETYRIGSVEEAAICADWLLDAWTDTPGAVYWLNTERRLAKASARPGRRQRRS